MPALLAMSAVAYMLHLLLGTGMGLLFAFAPTGFLVYSVALFVFCIVEIFFGFLTRILKNVALASYNNTLALILITSFAWAMMSLSWHLRSVAGAEDAYFTLVGVVGAISIILSLIPIASQYIRNMD